MKQRLLTLMLMAWTCICLFANETEPVNLVFIGNSITYGANLSDPTNQAPPVKVAAMVKEQTGRDTYYRNCGHSGSATPNWLPGTNFFSEADNAANALQKAHHGVLFFSIMLGTNDTHQGWKTSPETYYQNMKTIIEELLTRHPEAHIIVNYPTWYSPNTHNGAVYLQEGLDRLKTYMPQITRLCGLFQKSERPQVWPGDPTVFSFFENQTQYFVAENGNSGVFYLHPNLTGGTKLAEFWTKSIIEHLADLTPLHSSDELLLDKARKAVSACMSVDKSSLKAENQLVAPALLSTNAVATAGCRLENLTDLNPSTYFEVDELSTTPDKAPWLQVDLAGKSVSQMILSMQKRADAAMPANHDWTPTDISLLASADGKEWTRLTGLHDIETETGSYVSPLVTVGEDYRFLRICIHNTASINISEGGALTWNMGELQLYSVTTDLAASPYTKVEGLKEACDALKALVGEGEKAIVSGTLTEEQRTALNNAIFLVTELNKEGEGGQETDPNVVYIQDLDTGSPFCFDKTQGVLKYASQIRANSQESSTFAASNLLNKSTDYNTIIWHTAWTTNPLEAGVDNYLQVHLSKKQSDFCFTMIGSNWSSTYDTPDEMVIMATNTPTDESSWVQVAYLPDMIPASEHDIHPAFYTSPRIDMGGEYNNIRFLIKKTVNNRKNSKGNIYVSLARFMVYQPAPVEDPIRQLEVLVSSMVGKNALVQAGDLPGFYPQQEVDAFRQLLSTALLLVNMNPTPEEAMAMIAELNAAYQALEQSRITLHEGYYRIQSGHPGFQQPKALTAAFDDDLQWADSDADNAAQLFRLVADGEGWKLQSVATGLYVGEANATGKRLPMAEQGTTFTLNSVGDGMFNITASGNNIALETTRNNAMPQGFVALHTPSQPTFSSWMMIPFTDETRLQQLTQQGSALNVLHQALDTYSKAVGCGSKALLTQGSQLYANSEMSGFPVSNLLNPGTSYSTVIFHSIWGAGALPAGVNNYLQVNLRQPQQFISFSTIGSSWSSTYDTPDDYVIMATNTPEDEASWQFVTELHDMIPEALHTTYPAFYTSPLIDLGGEYQHVRFVVISTVNNRSNGNGNIYFSLARFQVYGNADQTEYSDKEGLPEALASMMAMRSELAALPIQDVTPAQVAELELLVAQTRAIMEGGTGIHGTAAATVSNTDAFDLLGRKANRSARIYIKDGKKVMK